MLFSFLAFLTFVFFICTEGTTLTIFEGLPLLSSVRMAVGRTIIAGGIVMAIGTVAVGRASAVDRIVGAIGITTTGRKLDPRGH